MKILCGADDESSPSNLMGFEMHPIIPTTMSSIKVKSLCIFPLLNTLIVCCPNIAFVKIIGAISGLPQGPYTVKNLNPIEGILNK